MHKRGCCAKPNPRKRTRGIFGYALLDDFTDSKALCNILFVEFKSSKSHLIANLASATQYLSALTVDQRPS